MISQLINGYRDDDGDYLAASIIKDGKEICIGKICEVPLSVPVSGKFIYVVAEVTTVDGKNYRILDGFVMSARVFYNRRMVFELGHHVLIDGLLVNDTRSMRSYDAAGSFVHDIPVLGNSFLRTQCDGTREEQVKRYLRKLLQIAPKHPDYLVRGYRMFGGDSRSKTRFVSGGLPTLGKRR